MGEFPDEPESLPAVPQPGLIGILQAAVQGRASIDTIERNARAQARLVEDLLDATRIQAGNLYLERDLVDVQAPVMAAVEAMLPAARAKGVTVHATGPDQPVLVSADAGRLQQVAANLLTNAVKFTPDGGRVEVRAGLVDGVLRVAVADTGIGIAAEDQAAVFEEFRQVGRHYTNKQEGTGLGLTLTKRFVELHGGTLTLQSEPGKGSIFTFTLPSQRT